MLPALYVYCKKDMKIAILLFSLLSGLIQAGELEQIHKHSGTIDGKHKIGMALIRDKNKITGNYFYYKDLQCIELTGEISEDGKILLRELNEDGDVRAVFHWQVKGHKEWRGSDASFSGTGTWEKLPGGGAVPFVVRWPGYHMNSRYKGEGMYSLMGIDDDDAFESSVEKFCNMVKVGNKQEIAKMVSFPINVYVNGKRREVADRKTFIREFDNIFTKSFRKIVAAAVPRHLFTRYEGAMLSGGAVWFGSNMKVIAINN